MIRNSRGLTLAEVLVAAALSVLVISLCLPILQVFNRAWKRTQEVQSAQRATLTLSYRLRQDYLASRPESLQVTAYGQDLLLSFLSYHSPQGRSVQWSPQGEILWRKWVQYRFDSNQGKVQRREIALTPVTDRGDGLTPPVWDRRGVHTVSDNVQRFQSEASSGQICLHLLITSGEGKTTSRTRLQVLPALYALDTIRP